MCQNHKRKLLNDNVHCMPNTEKLLYRFGQTTVTHTYENRTDTQRKTVKRRDKTTTIHSPMYNNNTHKEAENSLFFVCGSVKVTIAFG